MIGAIKAGYRIGKSIRRALMVQAAGATGLQPDLNAEQILSKFDFHQAALNL